jgi:tetratricopeptide (TPR) repeat protein
MQFINGRQSVNISYTYQLKPTRLGDLTLGPFKGEGTAEGLTSNVVTLKVLDKAPPVSEAQKRSQQRYAVMRWDVGREELWLGERVEASLNLYVNTSLRVTQFLPPDINLQGFWVEDLEEEQRSRRARLKGETYYQQQVKRSLLTPLKAGELSLPELSTTMSLSSLGFFGEEQELTISTPKRTLKVKPLPPNPPKGFAGPAVGDVRLELTVDRTRLRADEGVQLNIKTSTDGLLSNTPPIELPFIEGLKSFTPTQREGDVTKMGRRYATRTQTWLLKPTRTGEVKIPSVKLPFFDPNKGVYEIAKTKAIRLQIKGGTPAVSAQLPPTTSRAQTGIANAQGTSTTRAAHRSATEQLGVHLHSVRTTPFELDVSVDLRWLWRALAALAFALWLSDEARARLKRLSEARARTPRPDRAAAEAERALQELAATLKETHELSYPRLEETLRAFLEQRFGFTLKGSTRAQACASLREAGVANALVEGYEQLGEVIDIARFTPSKAPEERAAELVSLSLSWVAEVEREVKEQHSQQSVSPSSAQHKRAPLALWLSLAVSASAWLSADVSAQPAQLTGGTSSIPNAEVHERFWTGDVEGAIKGYQRLTREAPQEALHWYNLGTAQANLGRYGEASYALRVAQRLAPSAPELKEQLARLTQAVNEEGVRRPGPRRLILPDETTSEGGLLAFLSAEVSEALMWVSLALLGLCLTLLGRTRRGELSLGARAPLARVLTLLLATSTLLSGLAWRLKVSVSEGRNVGVVVVERAPLHTGPAERFPAEVNVAGSVLVTLQGAEGAWQRVALFDGREGWLKRDHVRALSVSRP